MNLRESSMSLTTTDLIRLGQRFKQALEAEAARRGFLLSGNKVISAMRSVVGTADRKGEIPNQATLDAAAKAWCDKFTKKGTRS